VNCFEKRLPELLRQANFLDLADKIDPNEAAKVAERVRAATAAAPAPSSTRRVEITPELRKQLGED
jgi:hypothetical protein